MGISPTKNANIWNMYDNILNIVGYIYIIYIYNQPLYIIMGNGSVRKRGLTTPMPMFNREHDINDQELGPFPGKAPLRNNGNL